MASWRNARVPLPPFGAYSPESGKVFRIACTRESLGLSAFWKSTAASVATCAVVPTIHCWNTSLTSAAWPLALVIGSAHSAGNPAFVTSDDDPVYRVQFAGLLSGWRASRRTARG